MFAGSLKFLILSLCAGLAWGWVAFFSAERPLPSAAGTGSWTAPVLPPDYSGSSGRLEQELLQTGFLSRPVSALRTMQVEEAGPVDPLAGLQFLSAARINTSLIVQIRLPDGRVSSVKPGDDVLDGWIVSSTTPYSIQLERAGEQRVFGSRLPD
jgi:hypothetical protein